MSGSSEKPYAAAVLHFLDRESGRIHRSMCYPITRIDLCEFDGEHAVLKRTLIADGSGPCGKWIDGPPPKGEGRDS